jgi:hypothetical protein
MDDVQGFMKKAAASAVSKLKAIEAPTAVAAPAKKKATKTTKK